MEGAAYLWRLRDFPRHEMQGQAYRAIVAESPRLPILDVVDSLGGVKSTINIEDQAGTPPWHSKPYTLAAP